MSPEHLINTLRCVVGDEFVVTDAAALAPRLTDASGVAPGGQPLAWVRPGNTEQVSQVLAAAHAARMPVVPQGTLTGLAGGASALPGSLLLDLTRMDQIAVDAGNRLAVVQPGALVADVAREAAAQGLFYPPDPASVEIASMGGTVATNAGGMRCIKYGVTRDYVRSLEVVLADGTVVRTRPPTRKSVTALDLTSLIVGSEGTLAVVTEITVALLPAPGPLRGVSATFSSTRDALLAASRIAAGARVPATLEVLDDVVLGAISAYDPGSGIPDGAAAWLLAVTDARQDPAGELDEFAAAMGAHDPLSVDRADDPAELDSLLRARRAFQPAMRSLRGASLNEDVAVLTSRLPEVTQAISALAAELGVEIGIGGHVGDGNLHPVIAYDPDDEAQVIAAHEAHRRILELAPRFGGTISGEHGIGTEKLEELGVEVSPALRQAQRAIKDALDPLGLLNPGRKL